MRRIPGGTFLMGSDRHYPEEAPAHRARVAPFWMDETCVTNRQFAAFVADEIARWGKAVKVSGARAD